MSQTDTYTVVVLPAAPISTHMTVQYAPPSSVEEGEVFTFAGYLLDPDDHAVAGKPIDLYVDESVWQTVTTNPNGYWSFSDIFAQLPEGTHTIKARFEGDSEYAGCSGY